jgi:hypothetical protein
MVMVVAGLVAGIAGWPTFRSPQGGYTIRHPRHWHVSVLHPGPASEYTTLAPVTGGPAVHVYVYPGHGPPSDDVLPDVHCRRVRIGGLTGRRCRTLTTASPVTILAPPGRTYRISSDAGISVTTYDRIAASFRLIRPGRPAPH